jgi:endonuclease III related protein
VNGDLNLKLLRIYNLMLHKSGNRNWWPAETDIEMIFGAIFAQFVTWKNVETAICNLKDSNLMGINEICDIDEDFLGELIIATRFYKQKASKLKIFCNYIKENYRSDINQFLSLDIKRLRKELLSIYGIGEETCDSIILYAARKSIFVVDSYTKRIFARIGIVDSEKISYKKMQKVFMDNLEADVSLFNDFHAQIVNVGNLFCYNNKPNCIDCYINTECKKILA